jgi:transcriptional regulator with XRE-family HTH domain
MAVDKLNEKLNAIASKESSGWMEEAQFATDNAVWIKKSQLIALKVLRTLRELGMTQKELAERMGISPQQVNKLVKGKENLTLETIARVGEALGVDLFEVLVVKQTFNGIQKQTIIAFEESFDDEASMVVMTYNEQKDKYASFKTAG